MSKQYNCLSIYHNVEKNPIKEWNSSKSYLEIRYNLLQKQQNKRFIFLNT